MIKPNKKTITQDDRLNVEKGLIRQARRAFERGKYKKSLSLYQTIAFVCAQPYASEALFWIGCHYEFGFGVKPDKSEASRYYRKMVMLHRDNFIAWTNRHLNSEEQQAPGNDPDLKD